MADGENQAPGGVVNEILNAPPPAPAFYESFEDAGLKDWATKAAFKSPEDVAKIAHKFDSLKDADPTELVRIGKDVKPEDALKIMQERFGAPKDGAEYKLTAIEGVDKPTAEWAQSAFAKAGLSPWQAQLLATEQLTHAAAQTKAIINDEAATADREKAQLRTEWGAEYTKKVESGRRAITNAAREVGVPKAEADKVVQYLETGFGVGNTLKILSVFGRMYKEGDFIEGERSQEETGKFKTWYKPIE